jgi:hypothetical protein
MAHGPWPKLSFAVKQRATTFEIYNSRLIPHLPFLIQQPGIESTNFQTEHGERTGKLADSICVFYTYFIFRNKYI